jgi:hypothetical protein
VGQLAEEVPTKASALEKVERKIAVYSEKRGISSRTRCTTAYGGASAISFAALKRHCAKLPA